MSKFNLTLALLGILLFMGLGIASAVTAPSCAVTKYAVPGDTFTLKGPDQPTGVTYTYGWTVVDAGGNTMTTVQNPGTQTATFTIPTASPTSYYVATLSVGSGVGNGQITGCILTSCLLINVQLTNTCGISGASSVCQTDSGEQYTYTGNAVIATDAKSAYLVWKVDAATVTPLATDVAGKCTVDWTKAWTVGGTVAQTHTITVEVHSIKSNAVLGTPCTYPVTVLPSPVTTITPT